MQHEIDHLDGILFIDRVGPIKRRFLMRQWQKSRHGAAGYIKEVEPEEVESAAILQFPNIEATQQGSGSGVTDWLIYLSLLIGLIALGVSVTALRKAG